MEEPCHAECGLNPFRLPDILLFHYSKFDVIGYSRYISANGSNSAFVDRSLGETWHPRVENLSVQSDSPIGTLPLCYYRMTPIHEHAVRISAYVLILKKHMKIRCVIQVQLWRPDPIWLSATLSHNSGKSALAGDLMET
jgi:hypothetical protein